jgi:hypothetical protein
VSERNARVDIVVEFGTPEQRAWIEDELAILRDLAATEVPNDLFAVFVPESLEEKVHELQGHDRFLEVRSQRILGKNVRLPGGTSIVLSPHLYSGPFERLDRLFYYCHEFFHSVNRLRFRSLHEGARKGAAASHLENALALFDEYDVNRRAWRRVEALAEDRRKEFIRRRLGFLFSHLRSALDEKVRLRLEAIIQAFRRHGDVDRFWLEHRAAAEPVMKDLTYAFSMIHELASGARALRVVRRSPFAGPPAEELFQLFHEMHRAGSWDARAVIPRMTAFMRSFGVEFEDRPEGLHCRVHDLDPPPRR